jgi:hypothetical protein
MKENNETPDARSVCDRPRRPTGASGTYTGGGALVVVLIIVVIVLIVR